MKPNSAYCIRDDYQPNYVANTREENDPDYWSESHVRMSRCYQYETYELARDIMLENPWINKVIDVGCGTGLKIGELWAPLDVEITGVDQPIPVAMAKRFCPRGRFFVDDLEKAEPSAEVAGKYDFLVSLGVIEHLLDHDLHMAYLKALSHPDTLVMLATCDRERVLGPGALTSSNQAHVREWTHEEFEAYARKHGMDIIEKRMDNFMRPHPLAPESYDIYAAHLKKRTNRHGIVLIGKWKEL